MEMKIFGEGIDGPGSLAQSLVWVVRGLGR